MFLRRWMAPTLKMIGSRENGSARQMARDERREESRGSWMVRRRSSCSTCRAVKAETAMIRSERSAAARACAVKRCPEIGSGVVARHYEQIVKGGDAAAVAGDAEALVQSVKQIGGWCAILPEQTAGGVGRKTIGERAQEAVRADSRTDSGLPDERAPGRTGFPASTLRRPRDSVPGCRWRRERFSISQHSGFRANGELALRR